MSVIFIGAIRGDQPLPFQSESLCSSKCATTFSLFLPPHSLIIIKFIVQCQKASQLEEQSSNKRTLCMLPGNTEA
jgi:hypothetical protein